MKIKRLNKLDQLARDSVDVFMDFMSDKRKGKRDFPEKMVFVNATEEQLSYLVLAARQYGMFKYQEFAFINRGMNGDGESAYFRVDVAHCLKKTRLYKKRNYYGVNLNN